MDEDERGPDPLAAAIGELRQELIGWIDSRIAALRGRGLRPEPAPDVPTPPAPGPSPRAEIPAAPSPPAAHEARVEPVRPWAGAARERPSRTVPAPPPAAPSGASGPIDDGPADDPRRRLDALARQLGARLRQSEEARKAAAPGDGAGPPEGSRRPPP